MGYFPETAAAALAGSTVKATALAHFDFVDQPMRVWQGFGDLYSGGFTWSGIGDLATVSGIETPFGDSAPQVTLGLSGVNPALVALALDDAENVKGRDATLYIQYYQFDLSLLDSPYPLYFGVMDVMTVKFDGPKTRTIEMTLESLTTRRGVAPWGWHSDASQQGLYPGDKGMSMMPRMAHISTGWPWL